MNKKSNWLLAYKKNVYSQHGEDGVIKKILDILPDTNSWCVEFGAWDGVFLSNTANLIKNYEYSAVLIEGSVEKYNELLKNYADNKKVVALNKFVGFSDDSNLDDILINTKIPNDFDLLSIDIDGNDYHVWDKVVEYNPKLVVIEFNQTIPNEVYFVQKADLKVMQGASLQALVHLAKRKGYELIVALNCNAFFIRNDYYELFEIDDNSIYSLRESIEDVTYMFSGYDGKILLTGSQVLPWHGITLCQSKFQQLPSFLQAFPENYNILQKVLFAAIVFLKLFLKSPLKTIKKTINHIYKKLIRHL